MKLMEKSMPRILVLYYSAFGHTEALARAVAQGASEIPGAQVELMRVPELVPEHLARESGYLLDQDAPVADAGILASYDAVLFGSPTRFGTMAAQMRSFLTRAGGQWTRGLLAGKIGSVFLTSAAQQLSPAPILQSFHSTLLHHGMRIAEPPSEGDMPVLGPKELQRARAHGRHVASLAKKIAA
jgi:NAD(P)H dehydrogenase (quinone)